VVPTIPQSDRFTAYHSRCGGNVTSRAINPSERIKRHGNVCRENISSPPPPTPNSLAPQSSHAIALLRRKALKFAQETASNGKPQGIRSGERITAASPSVHFSFREVSHTSITQIIICHIYYIYLYINGCVCVCMYVCMCIYSGITLERLERFQPNLVHILL
jgi:hypothetical protein